MARLLPLESAAVETVAWEFGATADTLQRWRVAALAAPTSSGQPRSTAAVRLEAVIATAAMDYGLQRRAL